MDPRTALVTIVLAAGCREHAPHVSEAAWAGRFDPAAELRAFAGTWESGMDSERGCTWTVKGDKLDRACATGTETYTLRLLGPTQLALERKGGWERFGYARDGATLYVGRGSSGRRFGDVVVADGTNFRVVMTPKGCVGYQQNLVIGGRGGRAQARFEDEAIPLTCSIGDGKFHYEAPVYVMSEGMQLRPKQLELVGDALVDRNVREGQLRPVTR